MRLLVCTLAVVAVLGGASAAQAASGALYGVQDDAWLEHGPGTFESRLDELDRLGVDVVRYTVRWDLIARQRPTDARDHTDAAYDWRTADSMLSGLRRHGIQPVVTLFGTPRWANGGLAPNWAPTSPTLFADFSRAAATRYPWIRLWTIWNEPNKALWLRPTTPATYVQKLLNPAYAQIRAAIPGARVGGGMTGPRAGAGGVSPVAWIKAMGQLRARLDAYAHHPYPGRPQLETPWSPACRTCTTIAMADLERLVALVHRHLGRKRIWLTEYGYQTNPPDIFLGVSPDVQARHVASASRRAHAASFVDMLIFFLVRDDLNDDGWQSGFMAADGTKKPAHAAFRFSLDRTSRRGGVVSLWGQVKPRAGAQPYRLRVLRGGSWSWLGGTRSTNRQGVFSVRVRLAPGSVVQLWSVRDRAASPSLRV